MAQLTEVSHDPFARQSIMRETIHVNYQTGPDCSWCGTHSWAGDKARLFRYYIESDGGTRRPCTGLFCSVECFRTYAS